MNERREREERERGEREERGRQRERQRERQRDRERWREGGRRGGRGGGRLSVYVCVCARMQGECDCVFVCVKPLSYIHTSVCA